MIFQTLLTKVQAQFEVMCSTGKLYVSSIDGEKLWQTYLSAFKPENNPIWRVNSEHDGRNDHNFFRRYGNIVAIKDGKIISIFDTVVSDEYADSLTACKELLANAPIEGVFVQTYNELVTLPYEKCKPNQATYRLGMEKNHVQYKADDATILESEKAKGKEVGKVYTFYHYSVNIPKQFIDFSNRSKEAIFGDLQTTKQLFQKGLLIPLETLELVRDLIQQGSMLRGDMYLQKVIDFIKIKKEYELSLNKEFFILENFWKTPFARFANELIGTTCIELAEGKELNKVVDSFNLRVDPVNYQKAKNLEVSEKAKKEAEKKLNDLGYLTEKSNSFNRRYATIDDINVSEIKHTNVDNTVEKPVGLFGKAGVPKTGFSKHKRAEFDKVETVTIDKFMKDILPTVTSMEVFLENKFNNNLVALFTAAEECKNLMKWSNPFSWTYNGNLSGKSELAQMVEEKGGRLDGVLRFTHSWNKLEPNRSLMDAHVFFPGNTHVTNISNNYGNGRRVGWDNRKDNLSGGVQDVDYVSEAPVGYIPVENITFPDLTKLPEGTYKYKIHNWSFRKSGGKGEAEIAFEGNVYQYEYPATKHKEWVDVAEVTLKGGKFTIVHKLPLKNETIKTIWNLETNQFHKVNLVCESPNHWGDNKIGTKEYFFMLQDCKCDKPMRTYHIDQLNSELMSERRALELLGQYMTIEPAEKQLAGLGFNSTVKGEIIVKLSGTHKRTLKIQF